MLGYFLHMPDFACLGSPNQCSAAVDCYEARNCSMLECLDHTYIHVLHASLFSDVYQSCSHAARSIASCSLSPIRSYTHRDPPKIILLFAQRKF